MVKKSFAKLITLIMVATIVASLFAGCGKKAPAPAPAATPTPTAAAVKDVQSVVYNMGQEPDTIDPSLQSAVNAANVVNQVFEGLMTLDANNKPIFAAAEKVVNDAATPTKYVFTIRKDAKWSDGKPVTAADFEYAWKRVLDPAVASDYSMMLYYLKNGEAYNTKKAKAEDVGVKAIDASTLEVNLENATPFFLQLCALPTLMPVRKDIVEKSPEKWTQDPATYIGNGPFKMKAWTHDASIEFVKNDNYWDKAKVKLDTMKFVMIAQSTQGLAAFETGDVDYIDDIPNTEIPRLLKEGTMKTSPYVGTYYVDINNKLDVLKDVRVRKALAFAIDRPLLIEAVFKDGRMPATGWVPFGISDADPSKSFRTVGGDLLNGKGDIAEAKKLLAEAGYPDGKGFPEFEYAYNKSDTHSKIAQALQDMWKKNLGITVKLNEVDWKVFLPQRKKGNYQMARDGWIGDYLDPMTFMDLFTTGNPNNAPQYSNPKFDELIKAANKEADAAKRMQMLHDAEKIAIGQDMLMIPIAFYVKDICLKPYVKNAYQIPTGMIYFKEVLIEGKKK